MNHRERLLAALRREAPDQVPVTWELVARFAHALTGRGDWRGQCDAHRIIGSSIFNLQGVGPHLSFCPGEGYTSRVETEELADGSVVTTRTISTPRDSLSERECRGYLKNDPTLAKKIEYFVKRQEDYEIYLDYMTECVCNATYDVSQSEEARRYVGQDGLVGFWIADAVYELSFARHDTDYILDLAEAPSLMHRLLEVMDEKVRLGIEAFNHSAADVLVYDVCWGSTSLLSPKLVREYVVPRARQAVQAVADEKIIGFFTTGRTREVLPDLVDCEPAFIQHFDVLGDCDLAEVKRTFGSRICIMGNYSPVVLARGSLEEARREAQRCLDAAMEGGGYVMSTSDEVPADAKPGNLEAVVEYVAEHGCYA